MRPFFCDESLKNYGFQFDTYHWKVDVASIEFHIDLLVDQSLTVLMIILPNSRHLCVLYYVSLDDNCGF